MINRNSRNGISVKYNFITCVLFTLLLLFTITGCGKQEDESLRVVLTNGFEQDVIFRIDKTVCKKPELLLFMVTMQNQYEKVYGEDIWNITVDGTSLEENVKENALAKLAQIKTMNLMATTYGLDLNETEMEKVLLATEEFYASLKPKEIEVLGIDQDCVMQLYKEYALAQKIYRYIIKDINPEVSDDEARTITVQRILIKTYAMDGTGKKISYTENSKRKAKIKAEEALELAQNGEDFDELVRNYSDLEESYLSFGKGDMEDQIEQVAFNLGKGEISDIVETENGYEIFKCISTFDKAETDNNKIKIVEKKRKEVFGEQYNLFVEKLPKQFNKLEWNELGFVYDDEVGTSDFFEIIEKYIRE